MVVLVLAALLSGFFWLGYWTSELRSDVRDSARPEIVEDSVEPTKPQKPLATPTQQLDIRSEDLVRL